ncbi:hypothetical protein [Geodermatophilus sp. CPCC 205506]|uniref:hypothetical protein n=1 Tax=Geodermatophilus sp. CPCC 205506 TaxID=2936596 RepID=UPI003EEB2D46
MTLTVYLDQTHWVSMAQARVNREKLERRRGLAELTAADLLWRAVEAGEVRLPLSCAHLVETARAGAEARRADLADAMLAGYGGWHMRHPIDVRGMELRWGLRPEPDAAPDARDVFTQAPGAPFRAAEFEPYVCRDPAFPEPVRRLIELLTWRDTWAATLREDSLTTEEQAHADAHINAWADGYADLSAYMRDNPTDRDIRLVAAGKTYADLGLELAQAAVALGMTIAEFRERINVDVCIDFFAALPFVGRVMEVTHQRVRNPSERWARNDLNDLLYLACAAGYADVVVAEKHMTHHLRTAARHSRPGAVVVGDLKALQKHLEAPTGTG